MTDIIGDWGSDEEIANVTLAVRTYGNKKRWSNSAKISSGMNTIKNTSNFETDDDDDCILNGSDKLKGKRTLSVRQLVSDGKILGCLCCGVCDFKTNIPNFMTAHMKKHTRKKNVICEKCFRRFNKGIDLVNHIKKVHKKVVYKCFKTNKQNRSVENSVPHENVVISEIIILQPVEENPMFACSICGYEFENAPWLQKHMKLHTGKSNFVCTLCRNQFQKPEDMKRIENTDTGLFQFQCKCNCKYTLSNPVTGKLVLSEGQRPFECGVCACKFRNPYVLSSHMKTHLEKTAYKCSQCSYSYRLLAHLRMHMRSHKNFPS